MHGYGELPYVAAPETEEKMKENYASDNSDTNLQSKRDPAKIV